MTQTNGYVVGNVALMGARFTVNGVATNPSPSPTCTVLEPDGTEDVASVSQGTQADWEILYPDETWPGVATGFFVARHTVAQSGTFHYRWKATGSAASAEEGTFIGLLSPFPSP